MNKRLLDIEDTVILCIFAGAIVGFPFFLLLSGVEERMYPPPPPPYESPYDR